MVGNVSYSVAVTNQPWTLDIDCVMVSVGAGLGELGRALREEFPDAAWDSIPYQEITPKHPVLMSLLQAGRTRISAVITTPHEEGDLVDPNVGIPLENDQLDFAPYVAMLATVIADRDTPLPLSIGIFGEWGSGKSYFMGLLREQVDQLAGSGSPGYCDEVVQIGFNA